MNDRVDIHDYFNFVETVAKYLDENLARNARDVEYGEWELPFEAILIALLKLSPYEVDMDYVLVEKLAIEADIIEGGVLDIDTWNQFLSWKQQK